MNDIVLTSAVRENLLSLKRTADLQSRTQERLATGLKVNSALDNPNSFFTAAGLNDRASDLSNLLDNMGQSVQTIRAAGDGIEAITKLVESAKAIANQALQTQSEFQRKNFTEQYNNVLLQQIEDLARDAGYKGKNLLAGLGNELEVIFNEDSTSTLTVDPVDYTDTTLSGGLNLADLATGAGATSAFNIQGGTATINLPGLQASSNLTSLGTWDVNDVVTITDGVTSNAFTVGATINTVQDYVSAINNLGGVRAEFDELNDQIVIVSGLSAGATLSISKSDGGGSGSVTNGGATATATPTASSSTALTAGATLISSGGYQIGDTITITDGNGFEPASLEIDANTTVSDLVTLLNNINGLQATFSGGGVSLVGDVSFNIESDNSDFNISGFSQTNGTVALTATDSGFKSDTDIERTLQAINSALEELRSSASSFGASLSTVEIRTDFTEQLINTLEVGAGALTIADMNEEGANMLALQTRQQLSSTALSLANQAEQSVLNLF